MTSGALVLAAAILGLIYCGMALFAYGRADPAKPMPPSRWLIYFFWWPLYDMYLSSAKGVRIAGGIVAVLLAVTWVAWYNAPHV